MNAHIVTCERASRTFGTGARAVVAVHDATCTVERGARIAIVGPSGSGKSTLLHLLAGLDSPTQGTVNHLVTRTNKSPAAAEVGVVFQGPSLVPALTAQENVALPLVLHGTSHHEAQSAALEAMRLVGVHPFANHLPEELSGGQAQRVAVARVLVMRPRLILADEPTGRLDGRAAQGVVDVLLQIAKEVDAALVIATHDPHVSGRLATCWRMRDGRLVIIADPQAGEPR